MRCSGSCAESGVGPRVSECSRKEADRPGDADVIARDRDRLVTSPPNKKRVQSHSAVLFSHKPNEAGLALSSGGPDTPLLIPVPPQRPVATGPEASVID
ncbi:hypothetical protein AAFF_G00344540 [Aldrovandia affinis]|uniref:Uncharacterized protein n=1 Tax=Aldrovandia affinis TaxID=143900 RepID=A0AAD7SK41_9TELE|nr:hypothetical protein AAFF_G00344540 [Aldrovandia affinis]